MAEVSATPLVRKLGIKPDHRLAIVNAPANFMRTLGPLPAGCLTFTPEIDELAEMDVILSFGESQLAHLKVFAELKTGLAANGGLWLCWPKKASAVVTDLSDSVVQKIGLDGGLVDNKICSVDATWSAMRFVFRLRDRPRQ
jgi:hypothetical protein